MVLPSGPTDFFPCFQLSLAVQTTPINVKSRKLEYISLGMVAENIFNVFFNGTLSP